MIVRWWRERQRRKTDYLIALAYAKGGSPSLLNALSTVPKPPGSRPLPEPSKDRSIEERG